MRDVFVRFVLLGGTGGLAVLALHFAKPLLRRTPAKWSVWLWLLLGLRMLVPLGFAPHMPMREIPSVLVATGHAPASTIAVPVPSPAAPAAAIPAQTPVDWFGFAMLVWLAGAAIFLAWHIAVYLHARQTLLRGAAVIDCALQRKLCEEYGLRPRLLKSPAIQTPMAFGLLRPVIILPAREFSGKELDCILRHEFCHLKAKHLSMKALLLAVNALHWFNPAAWLLRRDAAAAMEQGCDEMVLRDATNEQRGVYSQALLTCAGQRRFTPALTSNMNGGTNEMKARLRNIFTAKPKRTILVSVVVLLCAALAVTAAGVGPGLAAGRANVRRENDRNIAEIPNANGEPEDVILPDPGEDCSAVAQLNDGSKLNIDTTGNYAPLVELGALRNPCPEADSVLVWFPAESEGMENEMTTYYAKFAGSDGLAGPVERLEFSGENVSFDTEIRAAKGGTVARIYVDGRYGNVVELDHGGGYTSSYGNCDSVTVAEGETVKAGQPIALVGSTGLSTGPHLSFWLRYNGGYPGSSLYQFAG